MAVVSFDTNVVSLLQQAGYNVQSLKSDLERYFSDPSNVPWYVGLDAPLERPTQAMMADLNHIHMYDPSECCKNQWTYGDFPRNRREKQPYKRTSDKWLLYTRGMWDSEKYHVLGLVDPDAHAKCRSMAFVGTYIDAAEQFREDN